MGGREAFYNPMIKSLSINEPMPLDWELPKYNISQFFCSLFR